MPRNNEMPEDLNRSGKEDIDLVDVRGEEKEAIDLPEVSWRQRVIGEAKRVKNECLTVAKLKGLASNVAKAVIIIVPGLLLGSAIGTILSPSLGAATPVLTNFLMKGIIGSNPDTSSEGTAFAPIEKIVIGGVGANSDATTLKSAIAAQIASS